MIPQEQIDRIKEAANDDIVAIIEKYVKLKRSGSSYKGLCPFHDESTPSFSVSPRRQMYKCFGCGESGDAIDFIQQMEGMSFIEAIRHLAGMVGIIITEEKAERPQNYTPPSKVIPGIKKAKHEIRKKDIAVIAKEEKTIKKLRAEGKKNSVLLPVLKPTHAKVLAKYLSDHGSVVIICSGYTLTELFTMIRAVYKRNLNVQLAKNYDDNSLHWIQFLSTHFDDTKKLREAQIQVLAAIPDTLKRNIETKHFARIWDQ
ncbi:DNA primase, catalytic core [Fodinibius salinus]|uniref:DNA primase, catalytic core n=1 Tax=Fodinibius salinus TaxID=860790 RepID=A0A5D3YF12_9BACT|nr:CHC2 zinc finger domain-containing protein [Fodinibius salinus]TYP92067.1 DNA primase, catalytic core [Fodinibius salinus]